jgi:hypothetical protein
MAKGPTRYGAPVRGSHVENICEMAYLTAQSIGKLWHIHSSQMWPGVGHMSCRFLFMGLEVLHCMRTAAPKIRH